MICYNFRLKFNLCASLLAKSILAIDLAKRDIINILILSLEKLDLIDF